MFPYLGFLFLIDSLMRKKPILFYVKSYFIWILSLALFFFISFPAMWLSPIGVLRSIFLDEGAYLVTTGRDGINGPLFYMGELVKVLSPIFIGSFICGLIFFFKRFPKLNKVQKQVLLSALGFVVFYFLQMTLVSQKMERYLFPVLPFAAVIGGYGIFGLIELIKKTRLKVILYGLFFAANFGFIMYFFPYYLLFPSEEGKDQFGCSLCADVGAYLNTKDKSADLKVISVSEKVHRLKPFVRGKVYTAHEILPEGWSADYLVKSKTEVMPEEYSYCGYETSIGFRGVDYWEIYRCK
jgi:hypothetical protein